MYYPKTKSLLERLDEFNMRTRGMNTLLTTITPAIQLASIPWLERLSMFLADHIKSTTIEIATWADKGSSVPVLDMRFTQADRYCAIPKAAPAS